MDSLIDCCSALLQNLPRAQLAFVPAFILGILCSLVILLLLYKKYHRKTIWGSLVHMLKDIFVRVPSTDHSEFMKCNIDSCVRCKKSEDLKLSIIDEWKKLNKANEEIECSRIDYSVRKLAKLIAQNKNQQQYTVEEEESTKLNKNQKPTIFAMELPSNSFWTNLDCYHVEKELLKVNFKVIQEEFANIFRVFQNGNTQGWKLNHIPSGHWCIFPIIDQGEINKENCVKCPNTSALLDSFPFLMKNCVFGNACFSLLYPDSYIEPHFGPTNLRLRCHFGLHIPDGCWLEIDGSQMKWKEGTCLIFDDSYQHSAYFASNKSYEKPRVILLLDFWHPSVSSEEKSLLLQLLKPD